MIRVLNARPSPCVGRFTKCGLRYGSTIGTAYLMPQEFDNEADSEEEIHKKEILSSLEKVTRLDQVNRSVLRAFVKYLDDPFRVSMTHDPGNPQGFFPQLRAMVAEDESLGSAR